MPRCLRRIKETLHRRTSPHYARSHQTIPNRMRRFKIRIRSSPHSTRCKWGQTPLCLKTFSPTERNYEIYDRELLAIIWALEEWRHTTIILSDHKNLTYYREARKLNRQQARWSLYLSEFDVKLVHTPGHKMIQSDALSR